MKNFVQRFRLIPITFASIFVVTCFVAVQSYLNSDFHRLEHGQIPIQATVAGDRLELAQNEFKERINLVSHTLAEYRTESAGHSLEWSIERLGDKIPEMKKQADWLLQNRTTFLEAAKRYRQALDVATTKVENASRYYFDKAEEQSFDSNQQSFQSLGTAASEQAKWMQRESNRLNKEIAELDERLKWVEESRGFLNELEGYIAFHRSDSDSQVVSTYLDQLNSYIKEFEQLMSSFSSLDSILENPDRRQPNQGGSAL